MSTLQTRCVMLGKPMHNQGYHSTSARPVKAVGARTDAYGQAGNVLAPVSGEKLASAELKLGQKIHSASVPICRCNLVSVYSYLPCGPDPSMLVSRPATAANARHQPRLQHIITSSSAMVTAVHHAENVSIVAAGVLGVDGGVELLLPAAWTWSCWKHQTSAASLPCQCASRLSDGSSSCHSFVVERCQ